MNYITIDNLIKSVKNACEIQLKNLEILKNVSDACDSRTFITNECDGPTLQSVQQYDFKTCNPLLNQLLDYNHTYSSNIDCNQGLHFRKWIFIKNQTSIYILSNYYGSTNVVSRQLDHRKTRIPCIKNYNTNKWYLQCINSGGDTFKIIEPKDISDYINDISNSNDRLIKSIELMTRLSKDLSTISFENTFEFGWILENAYKITIKKYEANSIYLENMDPDFICRRKVKISEPRLVQFIEKNKEAFKEIEKMNKENTVTKIDEKSRIKKDECQKRLDEVNKKLGELVIEQTENYSDMTIKDRISIHKRIQTQHSELFIKLSTKRKCQIQSCKSLLSTF
jgi:hypothetical protein